MVTLVTQEKLPLGQVQVQAVHDSFQDICIGTEVMAFVLNVPDKAWPSLNLSLVNYEWKIRFEFVLTSGFKSQSLMQKSWQAPVKLKSKMATWETPVLIY